jgi:hypothetical protein
MHIRTHHSQKAIKYFFPIADLAYAFGIKETLVRTCVLKELERTGATN